jgi:hypothetical protein
MTEQQPDDDSYPTHWGYHGTVREASGSTEPQASIAGMTSGTGFDDHKPTADTDTSYPAHWRI